MSKFCVFCGRTPENKNAEHVVPQWLMEMTGKKSRPCFLGPLVPNGTISFVSFKFPACEQCNTNFSRMESAAKPIINKILSEQSVSATEISLLLDWFDKVRIGFWLGQLCLTKSVDDIAPRMHIASRTGLKDRMLIIERVAPSEEGRAQTLNFIGPASDCFQYSPSAFQMLINNYTFTNVSEYGLVSRRLGFPYCDRMIYVDSENIRLNTINKGHERALSPVVRGFTPTANQTVIYQPIYKNFSAQSPDLYQTKYVLDHSLDTENCMGGIFYQKGGRPTAYLSARSELNLTPRMTTGLDVYDMAAKNFQLHNYVLENTYTTKFADAQQRAFMDSFTNHLVAMNAQKIEFCTKYKDALKSR